MEWEQRLARWRDELALFDDLDGWVPLAVAAQRHGVGRSTLRSWYRSGQIRSRLVDGPHGPQRLVLDDEVARRASSSARLRRGAEQQLAVEAQVEILQARVALLEARLAHLESSPTGSPPPGS